MAGLELKIPCLGFGNWSLAPILQKKWSCFGFYGLGVLYYSLAEGRLYLHPWQAVPSAVEDIEVPDVKVRAALHSYFARQCQWL